MLIPKHHQKQQLLHLPHLAQPLHQYPLQPGEISALSKLHAHHVCYSTSVRGNSASSDHIRYVKRVCSAVIEGFHLKGGLFGIPMLAGDVSIHNLKNCRIVLVKYGSDSLDATAHVNIIGFDLSKFSAFWKIRSRCVHDLGGEYTDAFRSQPSCGLSVRALRSRYDFCFW
jgi:hypothetical protein